ncbi:MAG: substrate-binding domain-containing protein, partial [Thermoanaerobaculia bacterium]|nr:substrate-binding domain-containing protein [Thermoanaerobaculia bacterium]
EFVAPVIQEMGGRSETPDVLVEGRMPFRFASEKGRTEYVLVSLVTSDRPGVTPTAYPIGKGSGSVTTFSRADGFVTIPRQQEFLDEGELVEVRLLGRGITPVDLVAIGSHCVGLDLLLGTLRSEGIRSKVMNVGSSAGLTAARRGECDLAGVHLYDRESGTYNEPFVTEEVELVRGYDRIQGIVHRPGDPRFTGESLDETIERLKGDPECVMVNRNRGSGTRALIDELLDGAKPDGYSVDAKSHHAVAAAVAQRRADWGVCIETVAGDAGLAFIPVREERYDFLVPRSRLSREPVRRFIEALDSDEMRGRLRERGFRVPS